MTTEMRDPHFASYVEAVASSISWPAPSFRITLWEAFVDTVVAAYHAVATPNPIVLQQALRGIAF
jgi:hypothetical protein